VRNTSDAIGVYGDVNMYSLAPAAARPAVALMAVAATALSIGNQSLRACGCAPKQPPCEAYWQTPMVFLGTVTDALATRDGRVVRARIRVDRAYKGVSEQSLVLFDDGMCDGPDLRIGEQYLMYTRRFDNAVARKHP
jgi:hypothetical protein